MKWIVGIVALLIIGATGYLLVKPATAPTPTTQNTIPSSAPSTGSAQTVNVSGNEFAFTPATITVKKGQEVKLTFKNNGQYPHNFTVSELGIATNTVGPGEETTITFTPDKTGSFTYICTVPGHADRGMKGTLIVE